MESLEEYLKKILKESPKEFFIESREKFLKEWQKESHKKSPKKSREKSMKESSQLSQLRDIEEDLIVIVEVEVRICHRMQILSWN